MCVMGLSALAGLGGAGVAAAGATTVGALQTLATIATIGGSLYSGVNANREGSEQARAYQVQAATEAQLNTTQDQRTRAKMNSSIAQQRAELLARGIDLSSPTAVYLGQSAAQEMSFDSQAIRSGGAARQMELSSQTKMARAQAAAGLMKGVIGAAGDVLTLGPDVWPGLFSERQMK